jgi:hypothetical protein
MDDVAQERGFGNVGAEPSGSKAKASFSIATYSIFNYRSDQPGTNAIQFGN